jgi:uncharacterized membrane protein YwaF
MKEFFGFGTGEYPYGGPAEGFMSWQHIVFVTTFVLTAIALAIILGKRNRYVSDSVKNKVLIWSAILIDSFEIAKIIIGSIDDPTYWEICLPLFLCSIQLITIPLAAFSRGRVKEAALDFVFIFGPLGGILGTYGAAQNYDAYPVLSWPNFVSAVTHCLSLFAALYIVISGMASMKKKNVGITFGILGFFVVAAMIANHILDYNYMFLVRHDGTPYQIFYNLVGGHPVLYPMIVVLLFVIYIIVFNLIYNAIKSKNVKEKSAEEEKAVANV